MKRAKFEVLAISLLVAPLLMPQVRLTEGNTATMSDREKQSLRGPVISCTEKSTYPAVTDAAGKTYAETHSEYTTEYDTDGRILATRHGNSDGSQWVVRYSYDASGQRLKIASGVEGKALSETTYVYDQQGRLQKISGDRSPDIYFRYDERGRKTKLEISRAEDYHPNIGVAGSPFEVADRAPNLPGGGSATTIYDEHDRPTEVQVCDASGELVSRAVRAYDAQGHVIEEKQILDNPETIFPPEARAKMIEESGLSADQLRQELRAQLTKLMAGHSGPYSVVYRYDAHGRLSLMNRRIFNREEEIETTYNQHGDAESEITRSTSSNAERDATNSASSLTEYSEVRYLYQYDQHQNWIEKAVSYRSSPDDAFQSSTVIRRTLAYY